MPLYRATQAAPLIAALLVAALMLTSGCDPEGAPAPLTDSAGPEGGAADLAVDDAPAIDATPALDASIQPDAALPDAAMPDAAPDPDIALPDAAPDPDMALPDAAPDPDMTLPDPDMTLPDPDMTLPDTTLPDVAPDPDMALPDAALPDVALPDAAPDPDMALPDVAPPDPDMALPDAAPDPDMALPDALPEADAAPLPDVAPEPDAAPRDERCDGVDDDGDGVIDEGAPLPEACATDAPGRCAPGRPACEGGALVCHAIEIPRPERCDGVDDDCDGAIDEGLAGAVERCDGVDDDCDGALDERARCENDARCLDGACRPDPGRCGPDAPAGVCPLGDRCLDGICRPLDPSAACDDGDPCTADDFDAARGRCRHTPTEAACDDGDSCTVDACVDGMCLSNPIADCLPPLGVDAFDSPVARARVTLSGDRAPDMDIVIDGALAAPADGSPRWSVELLLAHGENRFIVEGRQGAVTTGAAEVVIVRDERPPTVSIDPAGGRLRDGVTVTITADEPATLFVTTDGDDPDPAWSPAHEGMHRLRIFDDTRVAAIAIDRAGNRSATAAADFDIGSAGNVWSRGPDLPVAVTRAAATALGPRLFVAGGEDADGPVDAALRLDVEVGMVEALPPLPAPRVGAAMVGIGPRIYVIGGAVGGEATADLLALPADGDGAWAAMPGMATARRDHAAIALRLTLYVFGGVDADGTVLDTVERYAVGRAWRDDVPPMPRARAGAAAVLDGEARVYLVGGVGADGAPVGEVDVYDFERGAWSTLPAPLPTPRVFAAAAIDENVGQIVGGVREVVVAGGEVDGRPTGAVEAWDPDAQLWRERSPLPHPRSGATLLAVDQTGGLDPTERRLWLLGGAASAPTRATRIYTHHRDYVRPLPPLPAGRFAHGAAAVGERIYIVAGRDAAAATAGWAFDPESGRYADIAPLPAARLGAGVLEHRGRVWVIGGADRFGRASRDVVSYDPITDAWTGEAPLSAARADLVAVKHLGRIWAIGGGDGVPGGAVEIFDDDAGIWVPGPPLPVALLGAAAASGRGVLAVFGGETRAGINGQRFTIGGADDAWQGADAPALARVGGVGVHLRAKGTLFSGAGAPEGPTWWADDDGPTAWSGPRPAWRPPLRDPAGVVLNGDVYLFGGAPGDDVSEVSAWRFEGLCFDGVLDPGEGVGVAPAVADTGGICGSTDLDGDGVADHVDLCRDVPNASQLDWDRDGIGDACDDRLFRQRTLREADVQNLAFTHGGTLVLEDTRDVRIEVRCQVTYDDLCVLDFADEVDRFRNDDHRRREPQEELLAIEIRLGPGQWRWTLTGEDIVGRPLTGPNNAAALTITAVPAP